MSGNCSASLYATKNNRKSKVGCVREADATEQRKKERKKRRVRV